MITDELQTFEVPLSKLLAWNDNVRTTRADEGIGELAASIASVGLLQGLVVKKQPRGKYAVIAGRRRLLALSQLASNGTIKATMMIPCRVAPTDADLPEISLAENVMRVPMHPADEFEAFQRLVSAGKSVADVAARFGVTEAVVERRLSLARVSPTLIGKYRDGELNLELLQAFTISDDHAAQEAVWNQLQPWDRKAQTIRRMLSKDDVPANDKHVRFVGLPAYEAAGGTMRRDLFAEGEHGTYISDPAKLNRLVGEKLQTIAEAVKAEGWKWVELQPTLDYQSLSRYKRIHAPVLALSTEAEAEREALEQERDSLANRLDESCEDDNQNATLYEEIEDLNDRIQAIQRSRKRAYSDDVKRSCGVVISVGDGGEPDFVYGLLRKEDQAEFSATETSDDTDQPCPASSETTHELPGYSAALVEMLTQHKTAAIALELSRQPRTALAALVHVLVLNQFGLELGFYRLKSSLQISSSEAHLAGATGSSVLALLEEQKMEWLTKLPRSAAQLWHWCVEQDQDTLFQLLSHCVARTFNGVKPKGDVNCNERLEHADALAIAMQMDMTKWFTPTAENFFSRVSKSRIAEALAEAGKPVGAEALKLKKADLAAIAEREVQGTRWLPEPLRVSATGSYPTEMDM